ncbi:hypothetical protein C8R46DRAFT_277492 [Mycena filopes]|nr:hypothetical protein C8R46DRAFT_277492 [Mycena filopes]
MTSLHPRRELAFFSCLLAFLHPGLTFNPARSRPRHRLDLAKASAEDGRYPREPTTVLLNPRHTNLTRPSRAYSRRRRGNEHPYCIKSTFPNSSGN